MTRKKKTRNPGSIHIKPNQDEKRKPSEASDKRVKKKHGKKPGNRQQEAMKKAKCGTSSTSQKDPRIGNKTPISLAKPNETKKQVNNPLPKAAPMAAVHVIDNQKAYEDELYAIEAEQQLQDILLKQEQDIALTEEEINYFNEKMDRHNQLREKLGWDDDEEDEEPTSGELDEDALWDKLDNNSFSDLD